MWTNYTKRIASYTLLLMNLDVLWIGVHNHMKWKEIILDNESLEVNDKYLSNHAWNLLFNRVKTSFHFFFSVNILSICVNQCLSERSFNNTFLQARELQIEEVKHNLDKFQAGIEEQQQYLMCIICMENEDSIVLNPCGHTFCNQCSSLINCPKCKRSVVNRIRQFPEIAPQDIAGQLLEGLNSVRAAIGVEGLPSSSAEMA